MTERAITSEDLDGIKKAIEACRGDSSTTFRLLGDMRVQNEQAIGLIQAAQQHRTMLHAEILETKATVLAQNGRLRTLEEWKNKAEGVVLGSRWTLALLTAIGGLAGGTGIGLLAK